MHYDIVCACLCVNVDISFGAVYHKVYVKRKGSIASDIRYHFRTKADVRHESTVHNVAMDHIRSALGNSFNILTHFSKVRTQNRR